MTQFKTLVILAAGNGSRFGGPKQFTRFGKQQKTLMEYNLLHAIEAGFNHVVFITQQAQKRVLYEKVVARLPKHLKIDVIIQDINNVPKGCRVQSSRTKPLGTAHALWCVKNAVNEHFVVINADDYYGREAFKLLSLLENEINQEKNLSQYAMVAYKIEKTLSDHGGVNRGLCRHNNVFELMHVQEVENIKQIRKDDNDIITGNIAMCKQAVRIEKGSLVSMNCWLFNRGIFPVIEQMLVEMFSNVLNDKLECYLPEVVMKQIELHQVSVKVFCSNDEWFGVTYSEDTAMVNEKLDQVF